MKKINVEIVGIARTHSLEENAIKNSVNFVRIKKDRIKRVSIN